jgi:hypothetical protein
LGLCFSGELFVIILHVCILIIVFFRTLALSLTLGNMKRYTRFERNLGRCSKASGQALS